MKNHQTKRLKLFLPSKIISLALIVLLLISTSGCKESEQNEIDERFLDYIAFDFIDESKISEHIHEVNLDATTTDMTIHLGQTLGDERTVYFYLDVRYSENIINQLKTSTKTHSEMVQIYFFSGNIDSAEISQSSIEEIKSRHDELLGSVTIEYGDIDIEQNTVSYGVFFTCNKALYGEEMTVLLSIITDQDGSEAKYSTLSWTPENIGRIESLSIEDADGNKVGDANISPFYLDATLNVYGCDTSEELIQSVKIVSESGADLSPPRLPIWSKCGICIFTRILHCLVEDATDY